MFDLLQLIITKSWEFFQIPWPGFNFTIGSVFLAVLVSAGSLSALCKMTGLSLPDLRGWRLSFGEVRGGNNGLIKVSDERRLDTK